MNTATWTSDLLAGILQTVLLLAVGLALPRLLRLRQPLFCLRYWQGLMLVMLLLPLGIFWREASRVVGDLMIVKPFFAEMVQAAPVQALPQISPWPLLALLVLGTGLRLTWLFTGLSALAALRRRTRPLLPRPAAVERAERLLGVQASFLSSPHVAAPVTFGLSHPVVVLPPRFATLSSEAQESVVCHELLHVRRRDWPWVLGEEVLRALLWFHPGVWILLDRISLSREQVIDRQVVQLLKHRRPYLEALWTFARFSWTATSPPAAAFLNRGHLMQRVTLLTQEVSMSHRRIALSATAIATALAMTTVVGLSLFPWFSTAQASEERILNVEGDVKKPVRIRGDAPAYPEDARKERIQGQVVVQTVIDLDGVLESMKVKESPGSAFDEATKSALSNWRFEPATLDGQPVKVNYTLTFNFRLE